MNLTETQVKLLERLAATKIPQQIVRGESAALELGKLQGRIELAKLLIDTPEQRLDLRWRKALEL